jgi:ribose transport system ATP-binding protein
MADSRLIMTGIAKRFGSTAALSGVNLELQPGEVHALVGENGAGKSTLMKVLSGAVVPDAGSMTLDGQRFAPRDPQDARRRGVAMIYQELTLAPHLSVADNMTLGLEPCTFGFVKIGEQRRRVQQALGALEHPEIRPEMPVASLNPAAKQLVEIARALLIDARVLVLDEPTSSLAQADVERLFGLIRRLRERGIAVVYISHFLEEIEAITDRFTVLRDGKTVGSGTVKHMPRERLIEMMVGRSLTEQYPRVPHSAGEPILELSDLHGVHLPRGVNLSVRRGEIVGIAGLIGAGRTELLRAIFGLDAVRSGQIIVRTVKGDSRRGDVGQRIDQGVGMLSEDRKAEGLALNQSIADNMTASRLGAYSRHGWLNLSRRRDAVIDWLRKLDVRCSGPEQPVGQLSGGNQQKVALGRLLHQQADLLLLDEPTRGVDVASKAEIYRLIGELAAQGKAVLFVSSYLPELFGVCDRLAVMARGRLSEVRAMTEWSPERVMELAIQ